MYYINTDIGKFNHCTSVIDSEGEVLIEPFFFKNNKLGFQEFLDKTKPFISHRHIAGLEATGHYGDNFIAFLLDNNYQVGVINPISTDAQRKLKIRKTKNDKKDTLLIANVLIAKEYTTMTKHKFMMRQTKQMTRLHNDLTEDLNRHKNRLQGCMDIVFPEYNTLFKTKYSKAYMSILKAFPSASHISNAHLTTLKNTVGNMVHVDATKLRELARQSVGEDNPSIILEIQHLLASIELVTQQLKEVNKKIEDFAINSNSPITSIPGIGVITGMSILSEIGDIELFSHPSKVIGFAGVDPATYQSGEYNAATTAISKRGSRHLRKSLYQCILTVCKYNPTFNSYYTLKRKQGKSHRCAQGHCVRKLLRVIYKILTENIEFDASKCI
jgi:Transposase and inactivated derivatives